MRAVYKPLGLVFCYFAKQEPNSTASAILKTFTLGFILKEDHVSHRRSFCLLPSTLSAPRETGTQRSPLRQGCKVSQRVALTETDGTASGSTCHLERPLRHHEQGGLSSTLRSLLSKLLPGSNLTLLETRSHARAPVLPQWVKLPNAAPPHPLYDSLGIQLER